MIFISNILNGTIFRVLFNEGIFFRIIHHHKGGGEGICYRSSLWRKCSEKVVGLITCAIILTEQKRREIYKALVAAEDRAMIEADRIIPVNSPNTTSEDIMKNAEKNDELTEKYKAEVRKKYGITEDVESKIVMEGFREGWPME